MKGVAVSASTRNYVLAALVSLAGLADAVYLAVGHLTGNSVDTLYFVALFNPRDQWHENLKIFSAQSNRLSPCCLVL